MGDLWVIFRSNRLLFSVLFLILSISFVSSFWFFGEEEKTSIEYTPTTKTTTNKDGSKTTQVYQSTRWVEEDNEWKYIWDAESLMGKEGIGLDINLDPSFPLEITDFNYTTITGCFQRPALSLTNDYPLKIRNQYNHSLTKVDTIINLPSPSSEHCATYPMNAKQDELIYGTASTTLIINFSSNGGDIIACNNQTTGAGCGDADSSGLEVQEQWFLDDLWDLKNWSNVTAIDVDEAKYTRYLDANYGNMDSDLYAWLVIDSEFSEDYIADEEDIDVKYNPRVRYCNSTLYLNSTTADTWTYFDSVCLVQRSLENPSTTQGNNINNLIRFSDPDFFSEPKTDWANGYLAYQGYGENFDQAHLHYAFCGKEETEAGDCSDDANDPYLEVTYTVRDYLMNITSPTTGDALSVSDNENITIEFNFTQDGSNVEDKIRVHNVTIGGTHADVLGDEHTTETIYSESFEDGTLGELNYTAHSYWTNSTIAPRTGSYSMAIIGLAYPEIFATYNYSFDLTDWSYDSCSLSAWFNSSVGQPFGAYLCLDYSLNNGTIWTQDSSLCLTDSVNDDGVYHLYQVNFTDNDILGHLNELRFRFRAYRLNIMTSHKFHVDDVSITCERYDEEVWYDSSADKWNVNVTVPSGGSGTEDLWMNASYEYNAWALRYRQDTQSNAIDYGGADSCSYTSGNWDIDCADDCEITSNVVIDSGANVTITGNGTFTVNGVNITGWTDFISGSVGGICTGLQINEAGVW